MISLLNIILVTFFFILIGWPTTYLLGKLSLVERLGLSFLLGSGLTTFIWFILYRIGINFEIKSFIASGLIIYLLSLAANKIFNFKYQKIAEQSTLGLNRWLSYLTVILLISSFIIGSYNPLTAWDSIALYDFRGHTIALNHDLRDLTDNSYYVSYPLYISLTHAVIYMLNGVSAQGIHALIFAAFIAVIYGRMSHWSNQRSALLSILLIILNKEIFSHSTFAYTNLPYIAYLISSMLYAVTPANQKSSHHGFLFIAALLVGLSTWVRSSETFWVIPMLLILIQGWRLKAKLFSLAVILIGYSIRFIWNSFFISILRAIDFPADSLLSHLNYAALHRILTNLPEIYWYLYLNVFSPYWGMWMMIVPVLVVIWSRRDLRLTLLLTSIILSGLMVTAGTMIFSTYYTTWNQIGDSARRMMLFIVPLSVITSVYALYLTNKKT